MTQTTGVSLSLIFFHSIHNVSNNTIMQDKKQKMPRNVFQNGRKFAVRFRRVYFGHHDTVHEAELVAISIREQLKVDSIETVKRKFDQENVRISCRCISVSYFFSTQFTTCLTIPSYRKRNESFR